MAPFHAACGGSTADPSEVFGGDDHSGAESVEDPGCDGPRWRAVVSRDVVERAAAETLHVGRGSPEQPVHLADLEVSAGRGGWVRAIVDTSNGDSAFGDAFVRALGRAVGWNVVRGGRFRLIPDTSRDVVIDGVGLGHGVGLCQKGAARLAEAGETAPAILRHYFPRAMLLAPPISDAVRPTIGSKSRAVLRLEELVQPKPERGNMPLLVENVRTEFGLESRLQHASIEDTLAREELDVCPISRAVPAKLGKHEVVNLESTKSEVLEPSGRQFDEPRGVRFRILGDCHAVKLEVVLLRSFAPVAGGILSCIGQLLHLQFRKQVPVPRRLRTLCLEPRPKPSTGARLTERLFASESTRFERCLEPRQVGHAAPKIRVALGDLPREGDREPQAVLEVAQLRAIGKLPFVKILIAKQ